MENTKNQVLHVERIMPEAGWRNRFYTHAFNELVVVTSGAMRVSGTGFSGSVTANDALLYPAGVEHRECGEENFPVGSIVVTFDGTLPEKVITVKRDGRGLLQNQILLFFEWRNRLHGNLLDDWLRLLLLFFHAEEELNPALPHRIQLADEFMKCHLGEPLSLEDLANLVHMSRFHFLREFKLATGETPLARLNRLRCQEAVRLLNFTDFSLKEIAVRLGFADASHFSRNFRRETGASPSEMRRQRSRYRRLAETPRL